MIYAATGWALSALALILVHHTAKGRAWSVSSLTYAAVFAGACVVLVLTLALGVTP